MQSMNLYTNVCLCCLECGSTFRATIDSLLSSSVLPVCTSNLSPKPDFEVLANAKEITNRFFLKRDHKHYLSSQSIIQREFQVGNDDYRNMFYWGSFFFMPFDIFS